MIVSRTLRSLGLGIVAGLLAGIGAMPGSAQDRPRVAFVTNGIANFWTIAEAGAMAGGRAFDCDVTVEMPTAEGGRVANQKRIIEQLLTQKVDGVAISPIDPVNQHADLNRIGANTNRLVFIGISNYDAGREVGKLVKQAIPDGGEIVIFIGSLDQDNSKLRRQGTIDEIFDRSHDPTRYDPPGEVITDGKEFDDQRKKAQPESALVKYAELDCMVGLFEYNPPNILEALRSADRLGVIKVVGFDENERTLRAIRDGHCIGTVVQDPYRYGFDSVRVLAALARGDTSVIPENKFISIPARTITADNVDAFEAELNERLAGSR